MAFTLKTISFPASLACYDRSLRDYSSYFRGTSFSWSPVSYFEPIQKRSSGMQCFLSSHFLCDALTPLRQENLRAKASTGSRCHWKGFETGKRALSLFLWAGTAWWNCWTAALQSRCPPDGSMPRSLFGTKHPDKQLDIAANPSSVPGALSLVPDPSTQLATEPLRIFLALTPSRLTVGCFALERVCSRRSSCLGLELWHLSGVGCL